MLSRSVASIIAVATAAMAVTSNYYVGLDRANHKCSVSTDPLKPGMKLMGIYKSQSAAEKAMHGMKACKT